ncbi:MAG: hypothetical protein MUC50_09095 [Myxococcota bacterium]|nr:hypothetical protein [Myxococcota bacterium]
MLVVISDLHFTDGTTSNWGPDPRQSGANKDEFNVSPRAFKLLIEDVAEIVRRGNKIDKVTFVYAGDIFDLLRTNAWFEAKEQEKPWAPNPEALLVERRCRSILEAISKAEATSASLAWLSGTHPDFAKSWQTSASIERVYLPGNHDRLLNLYPSCRAWAYAHLLADPTNRAPFSNQYTNAAHSTAVLHGHESDPYSCEIAEDGTPDYSVMPISDPMTTVLFARLGYEAGKRGLPEEVVRRLRDIDNIRPTLAAIRLVQDIERSSHVGKSLAKLVEEVVEDFEALPFYQTWTKANDHWNLGYDIADKLQLALRAIKLLGTKLPLGMMEKLSSMMRNDSCESLALRCLDRMEILGLCNCVLGHTHEPLHQPLDVTPNGMQRHYLNSGTFRATLTPSFAEKDFVPFQRFSYVVIYGPHEFQAGQPLPMYEMWSGLRRTN